jgi:hypothetical protein
MKWGRGRILPSDNDDDKFNFNDYYIIKCADGHRAGESVGPMWRRGLFGTNDLCGAVCLHVLYYLVV